MATLLQATLLSLLLLLPLIQVSVPVESQKVLDKNALNLWAHHSLGWPTSLAAANQTIGSSQLKAGRFEPARTGHRSKRSAATSRAALGAKGKTSGNRLPWTSASRFSKAPSRTQLRTGESSNVRRARTSQPVSPRANVRAQRQASTSQAAAAAATTTTTSDAGSAQKCALVLQRTYVRKLTDNDIEETASPVSSLEPTGRIERVCIKFEHVDQAIGEAKRRLRFEASEELLAAAQSIEPPTPIISQLGELNQETSRILAQRFDLSPDEILNGLPLIDMSRTNFWPICPLMVKPIQCDATGRFRSFTGHCNNLQQPSWGAAQTPFVRFLAPKHPDGIEQDRVSALDGSALPPPRLVTSQVHRDSDQPSGDLSLLIMVWGQIIDHDVAQAAPPRGKWVAVFCFCFILF